MESSINMTFLFFFYVPKKYGKKETNRSIILLNTGMLCYLRNFQVSKVQSFSHFNNFGFFGAMALQTTEHFRKNRW